MGHGGFKVQVQHFVLGDSCDMGKSFQHLDLGDRATIQAQLTSGMRPGAIAIVLKRARSTITREMHRNGWMAKPRMGTIAGGYRSSTADSPSAGFGSETTTQAHA